MPHDTNYPFGVNKHPLVLQGKRRTIDSESGRILSVQRELQRLSGPLAGRINGAGGCEDGLTRDYPSRSLNEMYFVSRYASSPSWASSRPRPLSFMPPKGHCGVDGTGSLMPMIPASSPSAIRQATVRSFVKTYAARP